MAVDFKMQLQSIINELLGEFCDFPLQEYMASKIEGYIVKKVPNINYVETVSRIKKSNRVWVKKCEFHGSNNILKSIEILIPIVCSYNKTNILEILVYGDNIVVASNLADYNLDDLPIFHQKLLKNLQYGVNA